MDATAARRRRRGFLVALAIGLVFGGAIGLVLGFAWRASEGADCGPITDLDELFTRTLIGAVAVVLLITAILMALLRHRALALGLLAASAGFGIAVAIGYTLGTPVPSCGDGGTGEPSQPSVPIVVTLHLGAPINVDVTGPGVCWRDPETGEPHAVPIIEDNPDVWTSEPYRLVDFSVGYGLAVPGLQIGLVRGEQTSIVFRQTQDAQVAEHVASDGLSGSTEFDLPLLDDSDVAEPDHISGTLQWTCP